MAEDGFSISSFLQDAAKKTEATRLAKKTKKQGKKEGILGGLMALLKPVAGFASKGIMAALKITNPYLLPLFVGLGTSGLSKIFETVGRKNLKLGADPSKIVSESELGYGKETAKTIREGLETSISSRDPFSTENIIGDIGTSYISALTPKIVPGEDGGWTVEGGDLGKTIETDLSRLKDLKFPWTKDDKISKGFKEYLKKYSKTNPDVNAPDYREPYHMTDPEFKAWQNRGDNKSDNLFSNFFDRFKMDDEQPFPWSNMWGLSKRQNKEDGGRVLKYYGGGSVEGGGTTPTIADYFSGQGVSLGGSNEKSLAEMLGGK